jgi:L-iditol 2-dehydrogenase
MWSYRLIAPYTSYLTHRFSITEVRSAFELACRPTPERIKIAIVA